MTSSLSRIVLSSYKGIRGDTYGTIGYLECRLLESVGVPIGVKFYPPFFLPKS